MKRPVLTLFIFYFVMGWSLQALAEWPSTHWLNGTPWEGAPLTVLAFVSGADMQFFPVAAGLKKLRRHYSPDGLQVALVVFGEKNIGFSEAGVRAMMAKTDLDLPVYLDADSSYSQRWRAYLTPSVDLVLKSGKVINLDPGSFDPITIEKSVQHLLKEAGQPLPIGKEFSPETTSRCPHSRWFSFGESEDDTWGRLRFSFTPETSWIQSHDQITSTKTLSGKEITTISTSAEGPTLALLAQSNQKNPAIIEVQWQGAPVPKPLRGPDLVEDKSGKTLVTVSEFRPYEFLSHGDTKEQKLKLLTLDSIKFWELESSANCLQ